MPLPERTLKKTCCFISKTVFEPQKYTFSHHYPYQYTRNARYSFFNYALKPSGIATIDIFYRNKFTRARSLPDRNPRKLSNRREWDQRNSGYTHTGWYRFPYDILSIYYIMLAFRPRLHPYVLHVFGYYVFYYVTRILLHVPFFRWKLFKFGLLHSYS